YRRPGDGRGRLSAPCARPDGIGCTHLAVRSGARSAVCSSESAIEPAGRNLGLPPSAMNRGMAAAALVATAVPAFWWSFAMAYRPFDGTDAAVAETGEMEIELGPVEYSRAGAERALLAPDLRINHGFIPGWEAALEGKLTHGLTA